MTLTAPENFNLSNTFYLNEPVAKKTSWQPIKKNGLALSNMILKSIEGSLEFHVSVLSRLFYLSFIILGSMFIFYATYALLSYHFQATLLAVTLGFSLLGVGLYMFSKQALPLIFDKKKNLYFKETEDKKIEDKTSLNNVHALQLLSYEDDCSEKKAELNLILENGERVYVCSYDDSEIEQKIREDAKIISEYIGKPVWYYNI